jgi:Domain of unknown function (DUF4864)
LHRWHSLQACFPSPSQLDEPEARAVRQVIEAQLAAFAANDAEQAFSLASSGIRAQFGNANNFMAMVRRGYPMVVRPDAVFFFQAETDEDSPQAVSQLVGLRDRDGRHWKATYLLQRQSGGDWRISGCVIAADSDQAWT